MLRVEVRPQALGDDHLGVGRLPEQEIAHPVLAGRSDDEVGVGQVRVVEAGCDGAFIDLFGLESFRCNPPHRVDYLRSAAVVQTYVEHAVRVARRTGDRFVDAFAHALREFVTPPADDDAHAAPVHLVDLALHGLVKQAHEGSHLGPRPRPVLRREGVHGKDLDTQPLAAVEHPLDRAHPGPVPKAHRVALAAGPAAVAVHDDSDVTRY